MVDRRKNRIYFRFNREGYLYPADNYAASQLRARRYKSGDVVSVNITKLRNPRFHRYAHILGGILKDNIDDFSVLDEHSVLKRIQLEGNIACDEIMANLGDGMRLCRLPRSLSYESMDEGEFQEVMGRICQFVCERYWPTETPEAIERMALQYVEAA